MASAGGSDNDFFITSNVGGEDEERDLVDEEAIPNGDRRRENTSSGSYDDEYDDGEVQDYGRFAALAGSTHESSSRTASAGTASPSARRNPISSQTIRRGEKDFEEHGTRTQIDALEQSRAAMETVLAHTRTHAAGTDGGRAPRGWYFPDAWKDEPEEKDEQVDAQGRRYAHTRHRVVMMEVGRGPMFGAVGAVPGRRIVHGVPNKLQPPPPPGCARVWLLPEEALFLLERGSIELWYPLRSLEAILRDSDNDDDDNDDDNDDIGVPLSLQAAYALLIGEEPGQRGRVALPFYQVYANLRRAGYQVLRAVGDSSRGGGEPKEAARTATGFTSVWQWLFSLLASAPTTTTTTKAGLPYGPLVRPGLHRSYGSIYAQLQLIPCPPLIPAKLCPPPSPQSPFRIVLHVWNSAGGHAFSKTKPPPPAFYLAVTDAHASAVPTLDEVEHLLASVPTAAAAQNKSPTPPPPPPPASHLGPVYARLKYGGRQVVVAVVDHGLVNYLRLGAGTFAAEPLGARYDRLAASRSGEKRGAGSNNGQSGKSGKSGRNSSRGGKAGRTRGSSSSRGNGGQGSPS